MLVMLSLSDALRWAALVLGLPVAALALVVLADAIPDRFVADELHEAIVTGQLDSNSYGVGYTGGQLDGFSECKRLTVGLGALPGTGTFESAVRSPTLGSCETAVPKLLGWASGEGLTRSYDYFRYWNGSAVGCARRLPLWGSAEPGCSPRSRWPDLRSWSSGGRVALSALPQPCCCSLRSC
jgi:hypothetical protein